MCYPFVPFMMIPDLPMVVQCYHFKSFLKTQVKLMVLLLKLSFEQIRAPLGAIKIQKLGLLRVLFHAVQPREVVTAHAGSCQSIFV